MMCVVYQDEGVCSGVKSSPPSGYITRDQIYYILQTLPGREDSSCRPVCHLWVCARQGFHLTPNTALSPPDTDDLRLMGMATQEVQDSQIPIRWRWDFVGRMNLRGVVD